MLRVIWAIVGQISRSPLPRPLPGINAANPLEVYQSEPIRPILTAWLMQSHVSKLYSTQKYRHLAKKQRPVSAPISLRYNGKSLNRQLANGQSRGGRESPFYKRFWMSGVNGVATPSSGLRSASFRPPRGRRCIWILLVDRAPIGISQIYIALVSDARGDISSVA